MPPGGASEDRRVRDPLRLDRTCQVVLVCQVSPAVEWGGCVGSGAAMGKACGSPGGFAGPGWICVPRALLSGPLGRRRLVRGPGMLGGGFGWDLDLLMFSGCSGCS